MYIFDVIWSLAVVIITAKLDKRLTTLYGVGFDKNNSYDDWFEYYNGRTILYKAAFVLSFIPFANYLTIILFSISSIVLLGVRIAKAKFWNKKFWDKIF